MALLQIILHSRHTIRVLLYIRSIGSTDARLAVPLARKETAPVLGHLLVLARDRGRVVAVERGTALPGACGESGELRAGCPDHEPVVFEEAEVGGVAGLGVAVGVGCC